MSKCLGGGFGFRDEFRCSLDSLIIPKLSLLTSFLTSLQNLFKFIIVLTVLIFLIFLIFVYMFTS